ncbi:hypothetical protein SAMN04488057_11924 [Cyclobacterium lianum]|uniref:Uncharacterized protein n=1 Tax=Cyclobacterium lianum TaxID=388280 RepID=A0A1M7QKL5_9BACT|nr:hypothetical protein [Cyclobacterium lianum]SHN31400.1 hypothetical protein SAMN04488057_11924 [Cyclobacterium lianum]
MKLRINNNSIRLRLTQSEVERIGKGYSLHQALKLGEDQVLTYALIPRDKLDSPKATFLNQHLEVYLPSALGKSWAGTDEVSIRHVQQEGTDRECLLLIEKDFQCLHKRPGEDERDNFPNPKSLEDYQNGS